MTWALDNWQEFDGWCLVKGINPLEIPAYRFYNLIVFALLENKTPEQKDEMEQQFRKHDSVLNVFQQMAPQTLEPVPEGSSGMKKYAYVPPWYREEEAYKNAMATRKAVSSLPK